MLTFNSVVVTTVVEVPCVPRTLGMASAMVTWCLLLLTSLFGTRSAKRLVLSLVALSLDLTCISAVLPRLFNLVVPCAEQMTACLVMAVLSVCSMVRPFLLLLYTTMVPAVRLVRLMNVV